MHAESLLLVADDSLDECTILHRAGLKRRATIAAAVLVKLQLLARLTLALRLRSDKVHTCLAWPIGMVACRVAASTCQLRVLVEVSHSVIVCTEHNALAADLTSPCRLQLTDRHRLAEAKCLVRPLCTLKNLSHLVSMRLRRHRLCLCSLVVRSVLHWL